MHNVIEAIENEPDGTFYEDEYSFGWLYLAQSASGEKYEISAIYKKDFPPGPEIAITKEGDSIDPIRLPHGDALGKDEETIKSSLAEISERCKSLLESGRSHKEISNWLENLTDD